MVDAKKVKGLFLIQLPPPYHGVSIFNEMLTSSSKIRESVDMDILPLNTAGYFEDIEKFRLAKVLKTLKTAALLFYKLLFKKYDFFYMTPSILGLAFYRDFLYITIIKLFNLKRIYHLHGQGINRAKDTALNRWIFRRLFDQAIIILLSEKLIVYLVNYVKKEDFYIFPNAIPSRVSDEELKVIINKRSKPDKKINFLFLSNILISKGAIVLLEAVNILKEKYDFKVNFCGQWFDDGCKEIFEKRIKEDSLSDFVNLVGYCIGEEKDRWLSSADIFIHPTLNDAYALVILEAMQFALPVISTHEGAIPEIISNGVEGLLVPKGDPQALAEAMERLINDVDLRVALGEKAREKFLEKYTFDKYEERMCEFLSGFKAKK